MNRKKPLDAQLARLVSWLSCIAIVAFGIPFLRAKIYGLSTNYFDRILERVSTIAFIAIFIVLGFGATRCRKWSTSDVVLGSLLALVIVSVGLLMLRYQSAASFRK